MSVEIKPGERIDDLQYKGLMIIQNDSDRSVPLVMVLVPPNRLSVISTRILTTMAISNHTSKVLPAGVSLLKIISKIWRLVISRYFFGSSQLKNTLCSTLPIPSMI